MDDSLAECDAEHTDSVSLALPDNHIEVNFPKRFSIYSNEEKPPLPLLPILVKHNIALGGFCICKNQRRLASFINFSHHYYYTLYNSTMMLSGRYGTDSM